MLRQRWPALVFGGVLLVAVVAVSAWLLEKGERPDRERTPAPAGAAAGAPADGPDPGAVVPSLEPIFATGEALGTEAGPAPQDPQAGARTRRIAGAVRLPDGAPAAGATVTLCGQLSAWPEWRREVLDSATTGASGAFAFEIGQRPDLLLEFELQGFVGDLVRAPAGVAQHVLQLQQGFLVQGTVTNDALQPVANATVALESTFVDDRRARTYTTGPDGRFRFPDVAAGTMRVIAKHPRWQPVILSAVVVGVDRSLELPFARPALQLEGRIVASTTQEPVAGATVLALPPGQQIGHNDPFTAVSGVDGRFRLSGLARGNLRLEVRHPDFAVAWRTLVVRPAASPLAIDLQPRTRVRGRLRAAEAAERSLAGAFLTFRSAADEVQYTAIAADGTFAFAAPATPGWGALAVHDGAFAFARSSSNVQQVRVDEAADEPLELEVVPPATVLGRVVDRTGQPLAGARLVASRAGLVTERLLRAGSALLEQDLRTFGDQLNRSVRDGPEVLLGTSGADGRFRIDGLAPGRLAVLVRHPGHGSTRVELEVPRPGETAALDDVIMAEGCTIVGRVQRGDKPLQGAEVGVVVDGVPIEAVSDSDGRYELRDLPPGDYRLRARYSSFPTVVRDEPTRAEPTRTARVDLEFEPGRLVRGQVLGSDRQPVEGAMVLVRGEPGSPVLSDSNGAFELDAPNRAVELQVLYGDRAERRVESVPLDRQEVTIEVDAPSNCAVSARVLGLPGRQSLSGVLVRIARHGADGETTHVRSRWVAMQAGRFRHPWFPAGRARVTFWCEGFAPHVLDLELVAGEERDLGDILLHPGCTMRGRVVDERDRPVPGAEVFLGDEADLDLFQPRLQTDADGWFEVGGVTTTMPRLVVRADGYALQSVALDLPRDVLGKDPLVVRLLRGSTIVVVLDDDAGFEGGLVELRRGGRVVATAEVDEQGRALFPNRAPGDYEVQRFNDDRLRAPVAVRASGQRIEVALR